jgi:hypothetical protein
MDQIKEYIPFIIPVAAIELILMITALVNALRHKKYRFGNRIIWILIIICFQMLGPILYFTIGREDE